MKRHSGFSLVELIVIIVIMSALSAMAIPKMRAGMENRQARQVLETSRSLAHAVKMYSANHAGALPPTDQNGIEWTTLENEGYIKKSEMVNYGGRFTYSFVPNAADSEKWSVQATNGPRTLRVQNSDNAFVVTDTAGFYNK